MSSQKVWWYAVGQEKFGPLASDELVKLARNGTLMPDMLVWRDGYANWVRASKLRRLWEHVTEPASLDPNTLTPTEFSRTLPPSEKQPPLHFSRQSVSTQEGDVPQEKPEPLWSGDGASGHSRPSSAHAASARSGRNHANEETGFVWAVKRCYQKYFGFSGRASRAEFWWFVLFTMLVWFAVASVLFTISPSITPEALQNPEQFMMSPEWRRFDTISDIVSLVYLIAVGIPTFAVSARRLHDVGRSGWWQLLVLTFIGAFLLLFWYLQPGDDGANDYGESPL